MSKLSKPKASQGHPVNSNDLRMFWLYLSTFLAAGASNASKTLFRHKDVPVLPGATIGVWLFIDRISRVLLIGNSPEASVSARKLIVALISSLVGAAACQQVVSEADSSAPIALVNRILWSRVASAFKGLLVSLGKKGQVVIYLLIHSAVSTTFYGIMLDPKKSSRMIHKMTEKFIGAEFFESLRNSVAIESRRKGHGNHGSPGDQSQQDQELSDESTEEYARIGKLTRPSKVIKAFWDAFSGLIWFNTALHLSAAFISSAVQKRSLPDQKRMKKAAYEMIGVNLVVSLSISSWLAFAHAAWKMLPKPSTQVVKIIAAAGAFGAATPIWMVSQPALLDNFYTMFGPWGLKYLFHDSDLNHRFLFVSGSMMSAILADYAGNSWIGQVLFQMAVKNFSRGTAWSSKKQS